MTTDHKPADIHSDSAAVFACALSLWKACHARADADKILNLSECFNGMDQFMREVMKVGNLFEEWACQHVNFDELNDVWPYLLEDKFGEACLALFAPSELVQFDGDDCLRVALRLQFPVVRDDKLRIPIDVSASNPSSGSSFHKFRIQTVRDELEDNEIVPFVADDDPFDEEFGEPYFALYGVDEEGQLEHIADRKTYGEALNLAQKLVPGIVFQKLSQSS